VKHAGSIAIRVVRRVAGGKRPGLDRSFAGRFARRLARKHRRNWRENNLRPRGRGYDWARQLIPEELARLADGAGFAEISAAELAEKVGCAVRTVRSYVARLCRVNAYGRPASAENACLAKAPVRRGRGAALRVKVNFTEIPKLLKWLQMRKEMRFAKPSPQLSLPMEVPAVIPAEIQEIVDRMARLAAARSRIRPASEQPAKQAAAPAELADRRKGDLFPHTPQIQERTPSELADASSSRVASRSRANIPRSMPIWTGPPDRKALQTDWIEIAAIDRSEPEPLSERHRRRLMRHLRLACWNRGLDLVQTRRVAGAIGWEAQRLRKASTRKYLIIGGINWVLRASAAELRGAAAHFMGMVKVVRALSGGSDEQPAESKNRRSRGS
jgi:hypothetical protein